VLTASVWGAAHTLPKFHNPIVSEAKALDPTQHKSLTHALSPVSHSQQPLTGHTLEDTVILQKHSLEVLFLPRGASLTAT
jgi:hypothetical protein